MTERERAALLLVVDLLVASDGYTTGTEREALRARLRLMRPRLGERDELVADSIAQLQVRVLAP